MASGLIDRLAQHHRVVAFDRPGFGYSERPRDRLWTAAAQAELLNKAIGQLGLERPIVIGHSWGTLVALELALRANAAVQKLILVSGYYFPTARLDAALAAPPMFAPQPVPADFLPILVREIKRYNLAITRTLLLSAPGTTRCRGAFFLALPVFSGARADVPVWRLVGAPVTTFRFRQMFADIRPDVQVRLGHEVSGDRGGQEQEEGNQQLVDG